MSKELWLTVVLVDQWGSDCRFVNTGKSGPDTRRTVHVALTPGQLNALTLREVGRNSGEPVYETIESCWIEDDPVMVRGCREVPAREEAAE